MAHEPAQTLSAALRALRDGYRTELPAKIRALDAAWAAALAGEEQSAEKLRALIHNLSGSGAVFGFVEISRRAAAIERDLDALLDRGATSAAELLPLAPAIEALADTCLRYASARLTAEATSATASESIRPSSA
jgi:HPt (histidine-containing phosphotransfer) domain-containing protein